jgi:hypothetical protein
VGHGTSYHVARIKRRLSDYNPGGGRGSVKGEISTAVETP